MDTSDPEIAFDEQGICNHCTEAMKFLATIGARDGLGAQELSLLADQAKSLGRGKPYDVIIGLSGGIDSTYVAYLTVKRLGLRPLAVHFDNGWNSELAVSNIEQTVKALGIDLYTHVVDWNEFRDLQLSFFKSHTSNLEIPSDHGIRALLYQTASKHGIRHVLSGGNAATEFILPRTWQHPHSDLKFLRAIHRRFGTVPLRTLPMLSIPRMAYYTFAKRLRFHRILDSIDYNKAAAIDTIKRELGWRPYGVKHGESTFTRFFQSYIQPHKFGFDKRQAHLSTLIAAGQISRESALSELQNDVYTPSELQIEIAYITKKLGVSRKEFDDYIATPPIPSNAYPNHLWLQARLRPLWAWATR